MNLRAYLSNLSPLWPVPRQEAALAAAVPGWPKGVAVFRDELPPRARRAHQPASLEGRASLLRVSSRRRPETILVASLAVLAWSADDLLLALTAALARGATVRALDAGLTIPPVEGAALLHQAVQAFTAARQRGEAIDVGRRGAQASAAVRSARTAAAIARIAARWPLPSDAHPTAALVAEAGVARNTIEARLGKRPAAQRQHAATQERKARRHVKAT